jgi:hypothetical protein
MAVDPLVPPLGEVLDRVLSPQEIAEFTAHVKPLVESGTGQERQALAYLAAAKRDRHVFPERSQVAVNDLPFSALTVSSEMDRRRVSVEIAIRARAACPVGHLFPEVTEVGPGDRLPWSRQAPGQQRLLTSAEGFAQL